MLESWVLGEWTRGGGDGREYADAVTGETMGHLSTAGIDMEAVVRFGRETGGTTLRSFTFHERAAMLKEVGKLLLSDEVKSPLYAASTRTGATAADSWIDIDGGASVLLTYASKGRKELPNARVALDGEPEILARDGSFLAAHILTPRTGVAVQINAFNFPVWGMLEKFAPAFLAGMPSIVKPASSTAFLTANAVRVILESGILPEGSLQLLCGSTGDLFNHLDGQDNVSFTGSADTARLLRADETIVRNAVRFNAEADSLNAAVLADSAGPETAEFDLFVAEVVKEMTTKAGQKCTAIRRAMVPERHLAAATEAIEAALADVTVGNPAAEGVDMGTLASVDQRAEVERAVAALSTAADAVGGSWDFVDIDAERSAVMAPVLLRAADANASVLHEAEAFGPVATVMGYKSVDHAIKLVAAGRGSLVASVYGADPSEVAPLVEGIAAQHGRVLVVDSTMAAASTGHGSPLPHLVHGGPGRAGGGEEMGGIRGVEHHMQRTAVQGSPDMLTAITGELMPGSTITETKGHPFKLRFEDLDVGDSITTEPRVVTLEDIAHFAEFTGDTFYAHMDEEAAKRSPIFGGLVAHGYLVLSFAAGLFVWPDEGPVLANYGLDRLRFATPTYPGDEIHVVLTCKRKTLLAGRGYGEVSWSARVLNQNGELAAVYDILTMVAADS
ncbi:MAG: phenylacetic acid degradation bifunctional protein PaaZ [Acidimicrobiales bacterium]|nr:phenylacetic acid degradation bifunctional protein PaaZ [Acidimicrobiales bacterium]RZV47435.1 MAG: phenylacetic acid degradation bifunctional protein PaaZ [Acidimicrobiales bacterium]